MSRSIRWITAALLVPLTIGISTPAYADPTRNALNTSATCSDGNTYDAVIAGNGHFLPAHVSGSTQVFKPVAYGELTTTLRDPDGHLVFTITQPAIEQGGGNVLGHNPHHYLDCTVSADVLQSDGYHLALEGTVTGFFTGPR